jgi:hypothetical protein
MKRILILASLLAGCGPTTGDKPGDVQSLRALDPLLYEDRVSGCEYVAARNDHALTPRIAADGKTHMGCREVRRSGDSTVART